MFERIGETIARIIVASALKLTSPSKVEEQARRAREYRELRGAIRRLADAKFSSTQNATKERND